MSNNEAISVTLKGDSAPWVVLKADTLEEMEALVAGVADLNQKIIEAAISFKSAGASLTGARGASSAAVAPAPVAAAAPPGQVKLKVPFGDPNKDAIKAAGSRWDKDQKLWIAPAHLAQTYPHLVVQ